MVVWRIPFAIACVLSTGAYAQTEGGADGGASAPASRYAAEQKFQTLTEDSENLEAELKQLSSMSANVDKARQCLDQQTVNVTEVSQSISELRAAVSKVSAAPPTTELGANSGIWQELGAANNNLFRSFWPLYECSRRLQPISGPGGELSIGLTNSILDSISDTGIGERFDADFLPNMQRLLSSIGYNTAIKRADLNAELIQSAQAEIGAFKEDRLIQYFKEQQEALKKRVEALTAKIKSEVDSRKLKLQANDRALSTLDKALVDKQAQQSALDTRLVYSIWGMIIALTVLFVSLRFFPESIALRIVDNRSLVEVMSMAFILLTIIILGTGDRIGKEAIGTLLGTIAGYIFGRKLAEDATRESPPRDRAPADVAAETRPAGAIRSRSDS